MMTPYQKEWALNNKDKINNNQKKWRENNKDNYREYMREYMKSYRKPNPIIKNRIKRGSVKLDKSKPQPFTVINKTVILTFS